MDASEEGVRLRLRVKPSAKKDAIVRLDKDQFKISVKATPIDNKANRAVVGLLSRILEIPMNQIVIKNGQTSPTKGVFLTGLSGNQVLGKLEQAAKK